jgi:hypothetical protein
VSHDDVLFGYHLRLFALAEEIGVRPACRAMGVHHSTYYRLKRKVDHWVSRRCRAATAGGPGGRTRSVRRWSSE